MKRKKKIGTGTGTHNVQFYSEVDNSPKVNLVISFAEHKKRGKYKALGRNK